MLYVYQQAPSNLRRGEVVRTSQKSNTDMSFHSKGTTSVRVEAAILHGEIRAVLEALQNAHCETSGDIIIKMENGRVLTNGTFYAWTHESEEIVKRAIARIESIVEKLTRLRLKELSVSVKYSLQQRIVDPV